MASDQRSGLHRRLYARYGRKGSALYAFGAGAAAIALSGAAAYALDQPLILLALGPTVYLFFSRPLDPGASPRSAVVGHFVALSAGFLSLSVFGFPEAPGLVPGEGLSYVYAGPAALAVAITGAVVFAARTWHPPAGVTAAIVGLGLLDEVGALFALAAATVLLTYATWVINRVSGTRVPLWSAAADEHP